MISRCPALRQFATVIQWRPGRLAWNAAHASLWTFLRIGIQAVSLILLARALGPSEYGILAASIGLFVTGAQLCGLGSGVALMRDIARGSSTPVQISATQKAYLATGILVLLAALPMAYMVIGEFVEFSVLVALAVAEIMLVPSLLPLSYRLQAEDRVAAASAILTIAPATRAMVAGLMLLIQSHTLATYCTIYLACISCITGCVLLVSRQPRLPNATIRSAIPFVTEGWPFALSTLTSTARSELDKTLLLRLSGSVEAGQYSAAFRIMQAAAVPVSAVIYASAARMFRRGGTEQGPLMLLASLYGCVAGAGLWILAPYAPTILGPDFEASAIYLRWLCLPLLSGCVRQVLGARLTTGDHQSIRNRVEFIGLILSLALLGALVPMLGVPGAAISLITSDLLVIAIMFRYVSKPMRVAVNAGNEP